MSRLKVSSFTVGHSVAGRARPILVMISLLLLLALGIAGRFAYMILGPHGGFPKDVAVNVAVPAIEDVILTYDTLGIVEASQQVTLKSEINGTIQQILFKEGQPVSTGQLLFKIKPNKLDAQLAQSQSELRSLESQISRADAQIAQANADLVAAKSTKTLAQSEYQRFRTLFKEELISDLELEQKQASFEQAEANYTAALERVQAAQTDKQAAQASYQSGLEAVRFQQATYNDTLIRAPFSGVMSRQLVDPGQFIRLEEPLATLVDTRQMDVTFNVPQPMLNQLRIGQQVLLKVSQSTLEASVSVINPILDADSRTVKVEARIQRDDNLTLLAGQSVPVQLQLETHESALVIPESAVRPKDKQAIIYLVDDTDEGPKAKETLVRLGKRLNGKVEVLEGLARYQRFVSDGLQRVEDGKLLRFKDSAASAESSAAPLGN